MTFALLALALAAAVAVTLLEERRTRRLNRCLHELRRPLQVLELVACSPERSSTEAVGEQVRAALAELDRTINRRPARPTHVPVPLRSLTSALAARWAHADVEVVPPAADATLIGDPGRLGAAVDNLVANGLTHGTGTVTIEVRDLGPREADGRSSDPRHGHGLDIAAETVARSGGRLIGPFAGEGGATVAAIALPTRREQPG